MSERFPISAANDAASAIHAVPSGILQRACGCGQHTGGGECAQCSQKNSLLLPRHSGAEFAPSEIPPIVHEVLRSRGQPLDFATRAFMEPRFKHDFSQVRVHTDAASAESAAAVNSLAYTVGRDIAFASGRYAPGTQAGQKLLA